MVSLNDINNMSQEEFVNNLGEIYEHTPQIASQTWQKKPFTDIENLHKSMVQVLKQMSKEEQLSLIKAHPDLGSKAKMAEASVQEQAGVGLNQLSLDEYQRFQSLNQTYKQKFGFPFIIAVKNHNKNSILKAFEQRLENTIAQEKEQALKEINKIAWFRLKNLK